MKALIVFLFLFACASENKIEFDPVAPDALTGCAKIKGAAWFDCMKRESLRWEKIESSQGIFLVSSQDREGDYIIASGKLCFSDQFCRNYKTKTYSPSIWTRAKEWGLIFGAGIIAGFGVAQR